MGAGSEKSKSTERVHILSSWNAIRSLLLHTLVRWDYGYFLKMSSVLCLSDLSVYFFLYSKSQLPFLTPN